MFRINETVGDYRITREIGRGASGVVYEVTHEVTGRGEAMKVLTGLTGDEEAQRFLREIQVQAKLEHPHIARVHNAFREGGHLAMVMELVDGEPLSKKLAGGGLSREQGRSIIRQVLRALAYAHSRGVIHRDVKPDNILVDRDGQVKLTDFGLARPQADLSLTSAGVALGSVYYMAPEQIRNLAAIDQRADLYSTGAVLYEVITGRRPFPGNNAFTVMKAQVEQIPEPPSQISRGVSPALEAAILKSLEKDPAKRFSTADAFIAALDACEAPAPGERRTARWHAQLAIAAAATAVFASVAVPPAILRYRPVETLDVRPLPAPGVPEGALPGPLQIAAEQVPETTPKSVEVKPRPKRVAPEQATVTTRSATMAENLEVAEPMPEAPAPAAAAPRPVTPAARAAPAPQTEELEPQIQPQPSEPVAAENKPPGRLRRTIEKINPFRWRRPRQPEEQKAHSQ